MIAALAGGACAGPPARPHKIPDPFTVTARFDAASLGLRRPIDFAIGPDGNLYITDTKPSVTVIAPDGTVLRSWGTRGSRPGEFSFERDVNGNLHASIAVGQDGSVYVSDDGNSRVDVFTSTGEFIRQFGDPGVGDGRFADIFDLAVDGLGNVYVADDQLATLSKFSPRGGFEWSIGGAASTDPNLRGYFHLANVDPHGRVVAAVANAGRIVYIDGAGRAVDSFATAPYLPAGPCNVTVDDAGDTVVQSCPDGRATLLFDRAHQLVGVWQDSPFDTDTTVAFGPDGEAFAIGRDHSVLRVEVRVPDA
jgi:hypothetical protein